MSCKLHCEFWSFITTLLLFVSMIQALDLARRGTAIHSVDIMGVQLKTIKQVWWVYTPQSTINIHFVKMKLQKTFERRVLQKLQDASMTSDSTSVLFRHLISVPCQSVYLQACSCAKTAVCYDGYYFIPQQFVFAACDVFTKWILWKWTSSLLVRCTVQRHNCHALRVYCKCW